MRYPIRLKDKASYHHVIAFSQIFQKVLPLARILFDERLISDWYLSRTDALFRIKFLFRFN